ncbi:MAG TPA: hypothetical protein VJ865_03955 [Gemmatimonadaceae bacterium]|nr:hypothetical protein [Gemmatimonadaceae bacterium]
MKRRRFRVRNLLLAWSTYWLALIAVGLSPAIAAIWRVSQLPHGRGSVNAGVSDGGLSATVLQDGVTTYKGSISLLAVTLLIALPPLVMWAVFLFSSRTIDAGGRDVVDQSDIAALNAGDAEMFTASGSTSKRRSREGS